MAIRFIDTNFFKSPFVRGLKAPMKSLYCFIICDCNGAGIWSVDFEIAELYTGQKINLDDFKKSFIETGKAVDLKNGKYFFPDFIEHQYPKGLSHKNIAHKNFIAELIKYGLLDENLKPLQSPFKGAISNSNGNSIGNGNGKSKSKAEEKNDFELIYPFDDFEFKQTWEAWNKYRSEIKKPYKSKISEQAQLKELSKYDKETAIAMITQSIAAGWQGIFNLKNNNNGNKINQKSARETAEGALELLRQARERRNNQTNS